MSVKERPPVSVKMTHGKGLPIKMGVSYDAVIPLS